MGQRGGGKKKDGGGGGGQRECRLGDACVSVNGAGSSVARHGRPSLFHLVSASSEGRARRCSSSESEVVPRDPRGTGASARPPAKGRPPPPPAPREAPRPPARPPGDRRSIDRVVPFRVASARRRQWRPSLVFVLATWRKVLWCDDSGFQARSSSSSGVPRLQRLVASATSNPLPATSSLLSTLRSPPPPARSSHLLAFVRTPASSRCHGHAEAAVGLRKPVNYEKRNNSARA